MTSDGYQTFNYNIRNAGSLLYQYQFSPKTVLTGFSRRDSVERQCARHQSNALPDPRVLGAARPSLHLHRALTPCTSARASSS